MSPTIIIIILLLMSAFFSASELAIMGTPLYKIKQVAKSSKNKFGKMLLGLREKSERTLITILIGNNLVNVVISIYAASIGDKFIANLGLIGAISLIIVSVTITFIILTFGEIIPKVLSTRYSLEYALLATPFIKFLTIILFPIGIILEFIIYLLNKIFKSPQEKVSRDDVEIFVEDGKKQGIFSSVESMIIKNLLDFNERSVEYIVKHRTEVFALSENTLLKDAINKTMAHSFSRVPIYREDKDKIIGIIAIRDLLKLSLDYSNLNKKLSEFEIRKVFKVPLTANIMDIFLKMKKLGQHFAVVVDERGGTEGIVTFEDILEDMVGEIRDEYDNNEEKEIEIINENEIIVKGEVLFRDIMMSLKIDNFDFPEELDESIGDEDMISYIILIKLRHFAKKGEKIIIKNLEFEIIETNKSEDKIIKVKVTRNPISQKTT
ncbi:MAG: hemolysin family protein [Candidatus Absconditabacteria bacterium]